jgi:hypothetical protein
MAKKLMVDEVFRKKWVGIVDRIRIENGDYFLLECF